MVITLLSFATKELIISQKLLSLSGRLMGVDRCIQKSKMDLEQTAFYLEHKAILSQQRGAGYWLWKPYYILETLRQLQENDILVYADAGTIIWKSIAPLANLVRQDKGIGLFYNNSLMRHYTKRDVFVALDCDGEHYHNAPMIHAGLQVYRKCTAAISFLEEVLYFATKNELITDAANTLGRENLPDFIEHRHDQSIFALVAHRNNLEIYMDPSQYRAKACSFRISEGDIFPAEIPYQSIVFFHRYRNKQLYYLAFDAIKKAYAQNKKTRRVDI